MTGDLDGVRFAFLNGADPDLQMRAFTSLDFLGLFLHRSLRPTAPDVETGLMYAARNGNGKIVAEFLQHNAHVNTRLTNGYSALLFAASKHSPDMVTALLAKGADIHVQDRTGQTPLLFAAQAGQLQSVRLLMAKGEDIHETNQRFQTALSLAVENRHEEIVRQLLEQGANAEDLKTVRHSPISPILPPTMQKSVLLHSAKDSQTVPPVKLAPDLTGMGVATGQDNQSMPPLEFAARYGNLTLVKFLLEHSELKSAPSQDTLANSLYYAASLPDHDAGFQMTLLLLAHGAHINNKNRYGTTPLLQAARGANLKLIQALIARSADIHATERNSGRNALMQGGNSVEVTRLLLEHGLNVNAQDKEGNTPLIEATRFAQMEKIALLLQHRANVLAANKKGETPLSIAQLQGDSRVMALLATAGAH